MVLAMPGLRLKAANFSLYTRTAG